VFLAPGSLLCRQSVVAHEMVHQITQISQCLLERRMTEMVVTTGAGRCAKLQSNHHRQQTNTQFFTGRLPFLPPNQQRQCTEVIRCWLCVANCVTRSATPTLRHSASRSSSASTPVFKVPSVFIISFVLLLHFKCSSLICSVWHRDGHTTCEELSFRQ